MKTARVPALVFALVLIGYVLFLCCTAPTLPPRMASHFDATGHANGWMNRTPAVILQGAVGLILPLIIAAAFYCIKFASPQSIRLPRRDYWFAPQRRNETCAYLARQGFWLASFMVGLQAMVWDQLLESNRTKVPQLSSEQFLITLGIFGLTMIIWVIRLFGHFSKTSDG
ncbi:MAG TPA: DUF1648 domain-containing protein [Verrucomicrobiae bacterium]|jgi:uncharacterized membrane protein